MPTPTPNDEPVKPESVEEIISDFIEEFKLESKEKYKGEEVLVYHGDCIGPTNDMIAFIREAYTAGRSSMREEILAVLCLGREMESALKKNITYQVVGKKETMVSTHAAPSFSLI